MIRDLPASVGRLYLDLMVTGIFKFDYDCTGPRVNLIRRMPYVIFSNDSLSSDGYLTSIMIEHSYEVSPPLERTIDLLVVSPVAHSKERWFTGMGASIS